MASSTSIKGFLLWLWWSGIAFAPPLETYQDFIANGPRQDAQRVGNAAILARGTGTRNFYFLEVDPTTGALPVVLTPGIPANASVAPNGGPIATSSTLIAGNNAGIQTPISTDYGPSASALRTASQIGNTTGAAAFGGGVTTAQTLRVVLPTDQTPIPVTGTFSLTYDTDYGVVGPNTLRTASQIGSATGAADFGGGNSTGQTLRSIISSDSTISAENFPLTVDVGMGNTTGSTIRVVQANDSTISAENFPTLVDVGPGNSTGSTIRTMPASDATISAENFPTLVDVGSGVSTSSTIRVIQSADSTISAENFPTTVDTGTGVSTASTIRTMPASDASLSAENFPTTVDTNYGTVGANTLRSAAQIGNATGAAAFGTGTSNAQTLRVVLPNDQPAVSVVQGTSPWVVSGTTTAGTAALAFSTKSATTACTGLTAAYAILVTLPANGCVIHVFNGCNGSWILSINSGASDYMELESGQSVSVDFCSNGRHIPSGTSIQAKDGAVPPTTGNLNVSVAG